MAYVLLLVGAACYWFGRVPTSYWQGVRARRRFMEEVVS
jgi:hypothetical protein